MVWLIFDVVKYRSCKVRLKFFWDEKVLVLYHAERGIRIGRTLFAFRKVQDRLLASWGKNEP